MATDFGFIRPDWPAPARVRALATTRGRGASRGAWARFNLGARAGDQPSAVAANRAALAAALPGPPCWLQQVHGAGVIHLDDWHEGIAADAAWTDRPGTVAAILTADCLPVLLCDRPGSVVAAAHAGWRGLAAGVLEAAVFALPVPPGELLAWIGPGIGSAAYQVGPEVRDAFAGREDDLAACFAPDGGDRYRADLKTLAARLLGRAGVLSVTDSGLCTHADPDRFYSHRRDGTTGRMATVIWLD